MYIYIYISSLTGCWPVISSKQSGSCFAAEANCLVIWIGLTAPPMLSTALGAKFLIGMLISRTRVLVVCPRVRCRFATTLCGLVRSTCCQILFTSNSGLTRLIAPTS